MALVWLGIAYTVVGIIWGTVLVNIWDSFWGEIWDTIGGEIWGTVSGKIGDYVTAPIQQQVNYMCCFDSNIKKLEMQLQELEKTRQGVQLGVDDDLKKARVTGSNVKEWLKKVNEVTSEVDGIIQDKAKVKEGCLNGWSNLKLRNSLSRKAVKKSEVVVKLQAVGISYMETIPNRDFMGFESRRLTMEEISKSLKHDGIKLIGISGMGGIGKTTMVKEVAKRAKEDSLFDEVAMAVVSQEPNPTSIQACIADMLDLKLVDRDSPIVRANLLRRRLLQDNKKILVILDDVWEEFNLEDMGIPLGGPNKNLKMLYTSRIQALWHDSQIKKEIALELLSEDEAWQLFMEKAGDLADARDLQPMAKQIVNECGHLPLALVIIGSALAKKSKGHYIKDMWEDMLDQLTCARNTSPANILSSSLELSYKYVEDEEAKRLFLLCCLFEEDEDIRIEDLARYGFGLSLFDRINEMGKVRHRVVAIVDDLKSRYLLLDGEANECVKVHDVVRDMGIAIASKVKWALVRHGAVTEWPKTFTHGQYTAISVLSEKIKRLPEGLTGPNLEFLMLRSSKLEKLPPDIFEGMEKLKVLELYNFQGILTFQPLSNLTTLSLIGFRGVLDNLRVIGELLSLKILRFCHSNIKELPEEIGALVNLRLLDLEGTYSLNRIPRGVMSCLVSLEELYAMRSSFDKWEGEGEENVNLIEFQSLSSLNTLEIYISGDIPIPRALIFGELKIYKVFIGCTFENFTWEEPYKRLLAVSRSTPVPSYPFASLLRSSDCIVLRGEGCIDLVTELLLLDEDDGLQQLKGLGIYHCDTPECFPNTKNLFPILKYLFLGSLANLRAICRGPIPTRSFRELTKLEVWKCGLLENLFEPIGGCFTQLKFLTIRSCSIMKEVFSKQQREDVPDATKRIEFPKLETLKLEDLPSLVGFCGGIDQIDFPKLECITVGKCGLLEYLFELPIGGCFAQLEILTIKSCIMMKEVFWKKQQREDVLDATKRIEFPKLETLELEDLPSLVGFCGGIDQIDFPKLEYMHLEYLGKFKCLFKNNCNLFSNSEQNDNFGFLSLFPQKVSFPNLEVLKITKLENLEKLGQGPLSLGTLFKPRDLSLRDCGKLLYVFPSQLVPTLRNLEELTVERCNLMEVVFELEGVDSNEPNPELLSPLKIVELRDLPKLDYISKRDPIGFQYIQTLEIYDCDSLRYVFAPTVTKSIPQLRELKIRRCEKLSRIVAEKNGLGESSVDVVEFPLLESLDLRELPNLVSFFPNANATPAKSTNQLHNTMRVQPLFNKKVAFLGLEKLYLKGLQNVSDLWCSEIPTSSFSKLQKLEVSDCRSLRNMFHPSRARDLVNLKELVIEGCSNLEAVVGNEVVVVGQERKIDKTLFPQLGELQLRGLPNLRSFCNSTHPLEMPRLRKMDISVCPNMDAFSLEPVSLSLPGISWKGNLNNAIQSLQKERKKKEEEEEQRKRKEEQRKREEEEEEEWRKREEEEEPIQKPKKQKKF